jgi:hypothetical protein
MQFFAQATSVVEKYSTGASRYPRSFTLWEETTKTTPSPNSLKTRYAWHYKGLLVLWGQDWYDSRPSNYTLVWPVSSSEQSQRAGSKIADQWPLAWAKDVPSELDLFFEPRVNDWFIQCSKDKHGSFVYDFGVQKHWNRYLLVFLGGRLTKMRRR